jgi:hypothetical protein
VVVRPVVRRLIVAGRLVNFTFFFFTATFCLLTSSPFANEQFLKPHISAWLTDFVTFHTDFYWLALSVTALTLAPFLDRSPAKVIGWSYLAASAAIGIWLATHRVMPDVDAPRHALALAAVAFVPPALLAVFDHAIDPFPAVRSIRTDASLPLGCAAAAAVCWLIFCAPVPVRLAEGGLAIGLRNWTLGAGLAALAHAAAFSGAFVVLALVAGGAVVAGMRTAGEFALVGCAAVGMGAVLIARLILTPITIVGAGAWLFAGAASGAIVFAWSGLARHCASDVSNHGNVVDIWCAPLSPRSPIVAIVLLLLLPLVAFVAIGRVSMFDWDFMFQKLIAIAVSVVTFAFMRPLVHSVNPSSRDRIPARFALVAGLVLAAGSTVGAATWLRSTEANAPIGTYVAADPSLRLARDLLVRRDESSVGFYAYLRANTGLTTAVAPVSIDLVPPAIAPQPAPPHIFLFVIDSLRPDYLSTYNAAVTFTPAFDAFARDSVVFERAFSRYGGTGLSMPSIWAAGMIPHKEYVTPFAPMNVLAKLLVAYKYREFITASHITNALFFPRLGDTVDLDRTVTEMRHTLCGTLGELEAKLNETPRDSRPIFGHSRSLDLHIGNVWSARAEPGESFPGFHAAYASRVHRMDGCFGRFIEFLRRDGLYDDSVIILTADHGDSLGEGLRWGHGFTVFPEVMRIPLIVHLPRRLAAEFTADVNRVSFTVDVVPTLYTLLGQRPATTEPLQGSTLFAKSAGGLTDRRNTPFLVASSYGPSYGVLSDNGTRLYIADGINGREYAFDLTGAAVAGRALGFTDAQRASWRRIVEDQIGEIANTYRLPQAATAGTEQ